MNDIAARVSAALQRMMNPAERHKVVLDAELSELFSDAITLRYGVLVALEEEFMMDLPEGGLKRALTVSDLIACVEQEAKV